jgi:UDP-glucuronate 4-epimerase
MSILVTGTAGFIGSHVTTALLKRGETVIGVDNVNDYYDVNLKEARLAQLQKISNFHFYRKDLADKKNIDLLLSAHPEIDRVIHLAAQAGVRYSLMNPHAYLEANIHGHLNILELCRHLPNFKHLVYASSSSVYGSNQKLPFSILDPVEKPISIYAATKRSCELMSHTYSHLFQIPTTGLRFFTVYGPWGRPDMSAFIFTKAILDGTPLPVFNQGEMRRNFTYIDDIVKGTIACLDKPCQTNLARVYNIGNNKSEHLLDFIGVLEKELGKKAKIDFQPIQPGDVKETIADISETTRDFGFMPTTHIETGLKNFVHWYRSFYATIPA